MQKILIILVSVSILITVFTLPAFALNGLSIDSYLSEPVPSDSVAYFAIGSSASDARLYSFFVNPREGHIHIDQSFDNNKWSFFIYVRKPDGSLLSDFSMWVGRYNIVDGTCYDLKYYSSTASTAHGTYHNLTLTSTYEQRPYIWYSGDVTLGNFSGIVLQEDANPSLMQISWNGTGQALLDIKGQITAIQLVMNSLYSRVDLTYQDVDALLQLLSDHYDWFEHTYYNAILDHWDFTNEYLYDIYNYLINSNGETLPDQSEFNNDIDSYINNEHQYIDNFESQINGIQGTFDQAGSDLNSFSSAFAFIGNVFNSFIPAGSLPYIFIFMSLTFGIVVLILGKQRS